MGDNYQAAYYIAIILMGPAILELCVNVCLVVLRATNKLKFKTGISIAMTIMNAILTILGVKYFGFYMAAVTTALSYIVGSVILMNIYYKKTFGFNMIHIYNAIFSGTFPCIMFSSVITYIVIRLMPSSITCLIIGGLVFVLSFALTMCLYGFTDSERNVIKKYIRR
jgi:O-antigen/teichoic acid export membrane protein